jgi:hypothetical protein
MATPAPGTIPALTPYQPGALPISGQELVEIASSGNATTAVSASMLITDVVGKTPSALPLHTPLANDLLCGYSVASGTPFSFNVGSIAVTAGNLPAGGTAGQILGKNSATAYDASWDNLSSFVTASTGVIIAGSTSLVVGLATATPLSVLGVAGAATAAPLPIVGTGAQVLRVNEAGNALGFGAVNLGSVAAVIGVLPGANYSAVNLAAAGAGGVQGVLSIASGGTNTSTLTANAVLLGAGAATLQFATVGTPGRLLIDQGASNPAFTVVTGDVTISSNGTTTIGANAVTYAKFQQVAGLSIVGVTGTATSNAAAITAGTSQVLFVNAGGTTLGFGSVSQLLDNVNTTQGSILYRSASSWVALGGGTNGQILQTQGTAANPQWVGGMVLLNTLSPNGVASTSDTTSLTAVYRNYMVTFESVNPTISGATFQMLLATTGTAFVAGTYISVVQCNVSSILITDTSTSAILLSGLRATAQVGTAAFPDYGVNGTMRFFNPSLNGTKKMFIGETTYMAVGSESTSTLALVSFAGANDGFANPVTGLNFAFSTGNIATGTIRVYGIY